MESLFNKVADLIPYKFIKKGLQNRYFVGEYRKIFNNTYFEEHLQMTASELMERFLVDLLTTNNAIYCDLLTLKLR